MNKITCPAGYKCKRVKGQTDSVCCPVDLVSAGSSVNYEPEATTEKQQSSMSNLPKNHKL
jgi:hypothetical protein